MHTHWQRSVTESWTEVKSNRLWPCQPVRPAESVLLKHHVEQASPQPDNHQWLFFAFGAKLKSKAQHSKPLETDPNLSN